MRFFLSVDDYFYSAKNQIFAGITRSTEIEKNTRYSVSVRVSRENRRQRRTKRKARVGSALDICVTDRKVDCINHRARSGEESGDSPWRCGAIVSSRMGAFSRDTKHHGSRSHGTKRTRVILSILINGPRLARRQRDSDWQSVSSRPWPASNKAVNNRQWRSHAPHTQSTVGTRLHSRRSTQKARERRWLLCVLACAWAVRVHAPVLYARFS